MKVKLIKDIVFVNTPRIRWLAGSRADVDRETADKWIRRGFIVEAEAEEPAESQEAEVVPTRSKKTKKQE